jgi:thioredoxin-related protein
MKTIAIGVFLALVAGPLAAQEAEMTVDFLPEESWADARQQAAEQDKYIFVDAYTDWCYWCKVQDKNTFTDEQVGAYINENFVAVKLDFERGDGVKLARKYRVQAYPSLLFFDSEGQLIGRTAGYQEDTEKFLAMLEEKTAPPNRLSPIGNPDELDPGFPEFYVKAYGAGDARQRSKPEVVAAWLDEQEDLYTEVVYNVLMTMPLDEKWSQYFLENHASYAEQFHAEEVESRLTTVLMQGASQAMRDNDEEALEAAMARMKNYLPSERADQLETSLRLNFYMRTQDMDKLIPMMDRLAQKEDGDFDNAVNSVAWNLYQNSDDAVALSSAAGWMEQVVERHPENYAYIDTYAAVLYKTGRPGEAKPVAEEAIAVGKAADEDVSGTEELMEKINQALQER